MTSEADAAARLSVVIDGVRVEAEAARAIWRRFSDYMEEHRGDLAGFARAEGFLSAHPQSDVGGAVLVLSHTAAQAPYGQAAGGAGSGGSSVRHAAPVGASGGPGQKRRKPRNQRP
jgi:hypothetical protein